MVSIITGSARCIVTLRRFKAAPEKVRLAAAPGRGAQQRQQATDAT